MSPRQQPTLSELRVGIFVVIACAVLALAIFAIGSRVGLFEEQFWALTYLSNVSGLKPGDVVLLGGVEVGNVASVEISEPGKLPQTTRNTQVLQNVAEFLNQIEILQTQIRATEDDLHSARSDYQDAIEAGEEESTQRLESQVEELEDTLSDRRAQLLQLREEIEDERASLQNIEVEMRINASYRDWLKADSNISLGSIGLLGDKYIEISLGRTDEPSQIVSRPIEGWLMTDSREFVLITGTQQASFGELITGANDILANFETLSDQVQDIMRSFEAGEGSIGKFITDPSFFNNLNATVENANKTMQRIGDLVGNMTEGGGTIGRLIQDDELHRKIVSATDTMKMLLDKIETGDGTLGRFVNDPAVYQKSDSLLENLEGITARMDSGEGTLGKLSTDEELYVSLRKSVDELSSFLKDVEAGRGTLGKLAKDEQLYRNLNEVSSEIVKLIYDFRQNPKKFLTIKFELF